MQQTLRLVLIADTFPPLCTSGAVQLRDLAREFVHQGHLVTVMLPDADIKNWWSIEDMDGIRVIRLKSLRTKNIDYVRRTLGEFLMPYAMRYSLKKSPLANEKWDGVVWYSPSIFHGPLVQWLKTKNACKSYLIIRDIFPEWAVDMGLMSRGLLYRGFNAIAQYQYSVADVIGVQTPGNLSYFKSWIERPARRLEVLQNWLAKPANRKSRICLDKTGLIGRKIFVYAGNMGVAQGIDILIALAEKFNDRSDVGFVFVGRGSETKKLKNLVAEKQLENVLFFDEIHPDEIPDLYSQCCVGMLSLDPRHKSHNIPGKFLTYMQSGLPVLANVNAGNDLAAIIRNELVGQVCESNKVDELYLLANRLLAQIDEDPTLSNRCLALFEREFSSKKAVEQIAEVFYSA
ncbi:glycosyltransferase family 4 protein [Chromobacterium sinusclupearum]|uniref:glycosyltransferase family 4 protein n=1 Tax=Chromobacterium sinusclupearum TaxID=2077146 RepID=UPI0018ED9A2B|nr:glycosyltransferase family 4 protein [Chromobacterium sinusclupearum]